MMLMKRFVITGLFLWLGVCGSGQTPDTLLTEPVTDTLGIKERLLAAKTKKKKRFLKNLFDFKKDYPSPKRAVLLSAILPGTGQIYNKKYWKLPLVYGAIGAMGYFIAVNTTEYRRFRKGYIYMLDEDPDTESEFEGILEASAVKSYRDQYRKNMELSYIGAAATYLLVGIDAFVDAHLLSFDVNDDLSLQIRPDYQWTSHDRAGTLGLRFSLRAK